MTNSGSAGEGVFGKRRARFDRWRRGRPFAGGALLILASLVIAWIPIHIAPETILLGKALSPVGLLFAALVFLCGMFALTRPGLADIFGVFGIVFSIFSLYGALGGFFIGTALGIIGGVLCYAWIDEDEEDEGSGGSDGGEREESAFTFDQDSSEEDSDGLFGSRSVRSRSLSNSSASRGAGGRTASVSLLLVTVVVLSAFAHPFIAAVAADEFPAQSGIDGTIVVAEQFSGTRYSHQNVTTDTSNRESVPVAQLSFESASMQGVTIYKNFRTGPQTPFSIKITGSSASASNGLVLTVSEFYATEMSLRGVVPLARYKWTTCPGEDFLLRYGDLGPLPGPSIEARGVTTNTHRMYAPTITIQNLTLRAVKGTQSTSVTGTPQCITNPIGPVLELFEASALEALVEQGVLPETVLTNATLSTLSAPEEVRQGETFDVSATLTNTGYVNDTKTVEYRFDGAVKRVKNVTLGPNENTTVTFADIETENVSEGTYEHGVFVGNDSVTRSITVTEPENATTNATNATGSTMTANETTPATNETTTANETPTNETASTANETVLATNETGGNETATTNESAGIVNETTSASAEEGTPTPSQTRTADSGNSTETTTATPMETTQTTTTSEMSASAETSGTETGTASANETQPPTNETQTATDSTATNTTTTNTTSESALVSLP